MAYSVYCKEIGSSFAPGIQAVSLWTLSHPFTPGATPRKYSSGSPNHHAIDVAIQPLGAKSTGRSIDVESAGSPPEITPSSGAGVIHSARKGAYLVERRSKGDQPIARNPPVGWLDAGNPRTTRAGVSNSRIRTECDRSKHGRDRGG